MTPLSRVERVLLALLAPALLLLALQGARIGQRGAAEPPARTVEEMLAGRGWAEDEGWRLARLAGQPRVVVLGFPGTAERGEALGRIAGPDADRAHRAGELLRRLDGVARSGGGLNPAERRLQALLQAWPGGMADRVRSPDEEASLALVATVATPARDPAAADRAPPMDDAARRSDLLHGLAHAAFATRHPVRRQAEAFWHGALDEPERQRWLALLRARGEDVADARRVVDEVQALLMHTPDERRFRAQDLGLDGPGLESQRGRFAAAPSGSSALRPGSTPSAAGR